MLPRPPHLPLRSCLALAALTAGVLAGPASAKTSTVKVPLPAAGQVSVAVAAVKGKAKLTAGKAPVGVSVTGAARGGRLAIAVVRPRGASGSGSVAVKVRGGKVKGLRTFRAALDAGTASGGACKGLGGLLGRPLRTGDATRADLAALGRALAARLCGKPLPGGVGALLARIMLGDPQPGPGGGLTGGPVTGGTPPGGGTTTPGGGNTGGTPGGNPQPDGVTPECAKAAFVSQGDDPATLYAAVNQGCGRFTKVEFTVSPAPKSCSAITADHNFACTVHAGTAAAASTDGRATDIVDVPITLTGAVSCAAKATIAITGADGKRRQVTEAIEGCGAPAPACSNGKDDDGDGQIDDRDATGATNPDPGCGSTTDQTEDSEIDPPDGCVVNWGTFDEEGLYPGVEISGCGPLLTAWIRPPGTPAQCLVGIGDDPWKECEIRGATVSWPLAETDLPVALAAKLPDGIQCEPATAAVVRSDGKVIEVLAEVPGC